LPLLRRHMHPEVVALSQVRRFVVSVRVHAPRLQRQGLSCMYGHALLRAIMTSLALPTLERRRPGAGYLPVHRAGYIATV